MALVSYDCSDSSDYEEESVENNVNIIDKTLSAKKKTVNTEESPTNSKLKDLLLPPVEIKSNFNVVSWSLFTKNRTQPIRISVPSLDDENDDDDEETKPKLKPSTKKSGLFSILPKPKQHLLVPPSVSAKNQEKKKQLLANRKLNSSGLQNSKIKSGPSKLPPPASSIRNNLKKNLQAAEEDDDEDGEQPKSFFFLPEDDVTEEHKVDIEQNIDLPHSHSFDEDTVPTNLTVPDTSTSSMNQELQPTFSEMPEDDDDDDIALDKDALEKLCGSRGKRLAGEVEMVDVSGAELVGDSKLWLAKELTTQRVHFKRAKFDPVQKRKHQITYLASYAREQELELSNQWASNRMTKKQTQAKYGF